jgi:CubicO group peptidase (beta-lactamase class C family)
LEEHGQLRDQAPICRYLARCPAAWQPITVHMLLDGTAQIPNYDWGVPGHTTAQSLRALQAQPLDGTPGAAVDYQNGDTLVEAAIIERVTRVPWARFLQHTIFGPAGMTHSGRLTDALVSPARAQDYSGATADPNGVYNDFYAADATAPDVYAYDNALFGGKLLAGPTLTTLVTPRAAVSAPPTGIAMAHYGDYWAIGQVVQHRVIYTIKPLKSFWTANLRFPADGVTLVVISNDDQNNVADIAIHLAALVFG